MAGGDASTRRAVAGGTPRVQETVDKPVGGCCILLVVNFGLVTGSGGVEIEAWLSGPGVLSVFLRSLGSPELIWATRAFLMSAFAASGHNRRMRRWGLQRGGGEVLRVSFPKPPGSPLCPTRLLRRRGARRPRPCVGGVRWSRRLESSFCRWPTWGVPKVDGSTCRSWCHSLVNLSCRVKELLVICSNPS